MKSLSFISFFKKSTNTKAKSNALLLLLVFGLLSPFDYSVYSFEIPEFNNLEISEGVVSFGAPRRSGTPFLLRVDGSQLKLLCRANSTSNVSCIPKKEQHLLSGKRAKVRWYTANIYGSLLTEKRLLQLETDEKVYLAYEKQKEKYLDQKNRHFYVFFIITLFSLAVFLLLQLSEKTAPVQNSKG